MVPQMNDNIGPLLGRILAGPAQVVDGNPRLALRVRDYQVLAVLGQQAGPLSRREIEP